MWDLSAGFRGAEEAGLMACEGRVCDPVGGGQGKGKDWG